MLFNAPIFLFAFLPAAWVGFRILSLLHHRAAMAFLVLASFTFYGWWNWRFVLLLVISMTGNFIAAEMIRSQVDAPARQQWLLTGAVAANIVLLGYFKYLTAMVGFLHEVGLPSANLGPITLPLGISFFTFTQIAYLVDVATGVAEERNPLNYAVFVSFFPHMIAGPILHHAEMMPQFDRRSATRFQPTDLIVGLSIFTLGLVKKDLIADPISLNVTDVYAHPEVTQLLAAWRGALSYSLQLYFDFSGYSDMAIGLARMFGITFPLNFNSPYKAASVIDYWQRWHMTLTRYLTQYVFNPLSLLTIRRLSKLRARQKVRLSRRDRFFGMVLIPLPITMIIAGIWHGAGLQFLIFGLLHAVYLVVNHCWRNFGPDGYRAPRWLCHCGSVLLTYLCVLVGSIFFRAYSVKAAIDLLAAMAGANGVEAWPAGDEAFWIVLGAVMSAVWIAFLYVFVWTMPNTQQIMSCYQPALDFVDDRPTKALRFRISIRWSVAIGFCAVIAILLRQQAEFLYFQF